MSPLFGSQPIPPRVAPIPRPEWSPLPFPGTRNVEGKVLVDHPELTVAMLRLGPAGTIHEHSAEHEIEVVCLEGNGYVSIDGIGAPIASGQSVHWPAGHRHRLWTEDSLMVTLMVEHPRPYRP